MKLSMQSIYQSSYNQADNFYNKKDKPKKFKTFTEEEVQRKKKSNKKDYSKERKVKTGDYGNDA